MKKPLFTVGEEVLLRSEAYPKYNGDAVVLSIKKSVGGIDREGIRKVEGGFAYLLNVESPLLNRTWHESALRKKHKPSELSFRELVSSLKTPIKA